MAHPDVPPDISLAATIRLRPDVVVSEVQGESVLLDLKKGYYYGLDAAGTRIWRLLQIHPRLGDAVAAIVAEYDVDEATCAGDLLALVAELRAHGLVEVAGG